MNKALFMDLDGTIIETSSGAKWPKDFEDWKLRKGIIEKIREYIVNGYSLVIVSNQGGIQKGFVKKEEFIKKIGAVRNELIRRMQWPGAPIYTCYSETMDKKDFYRKPNPGWAYKWATQLKLNLKNCIMVGDASGNFEVHFTSKCDADEFRKKIGDRYEKTIVSAEGIHKVHMESFSNSDKGFADNAAMKYYDVEEFLLLGTNAKWYKR